MSSITDPTSELDGHVDSVSHEMVTGWAADRSDLDKSVEIVIFIADVEAGRLQAMLPRDDLKRFGKFGDGRHGFAFAFPRPLSNDWSWRVSIRFAENLKPLRNGERTLLPENQVADDPRPLTEASRPLCPLIVSSIGRSGSTLLMKILFDHPSITAGGIYPFEVRPASYFAHAFNIITSPSDAQENSIRDTFDVNPNQIGPNPFHHHAFRNVFENPDDLKPFFDMHSRTVLRNTFIGLIESFYGKLALENGRTAATYFAEKCDVSRLGRRSMRQLYGSIKEIILVRDLRDAVCSYRKFFNSNSDVNVIDHIGGMAKILIREYHKSPNDAIFVKYEDLVRNRAATLQRIAEFLRVSDDWPEADAKEASMRSKHGTSQSAETSIRRWVSDLTPEDQKDCNIKFAEYLDLFGYI